MMRVCPPFLIYVNNEHASYYIKLYSCRSIVCYSFRCRHVNLNKAELDSKGVA